MARHPKAARLGGGTVFKLSGGVESVLHSLGGPPKAGVILVKGYLYGTTSSSGSGGYGSVFKPGTTGRYL